MYEEKVSILKALGNKTRLMMLYILFGDSRTWTELLFKLQINPKSVRDHLVILRKNGLVQKSEPVGFEITEKGKLVVETVLHSLDRICFEAKER